MKTIRKKVRQIIREELNIQKGRRQPPTLSVNGHINKFLERTAKEFARRLQKNYDIEFTDAILGDRSFQVDFKVYNSRQDMFKQGQMFMWAKNGEVVVKAEGGEVGSTIGDSHYQTFIDQTFSYSEDPTSEIAIVSAFQTLAGR